jgi:hypothetical protein
MAPRDEGMFVVWRLGSTTKYGPTHGLFKVYPEATTYPRTCHRHMIRGFGVRVSRFGGNVNSYMFLQFEAWQLQNGWRDSSVILAGSQGDSKMMTRIR